MALSKNSNARSGLPALAKMPAMWVSSCGSCPVPSPTSSAYCTAWVKSPNAKYNAAKRDLTSRDLGSSFQSGLVFLQCGVKILREFRLMPHHKMVGSIRLGRRWWRWHGRGGRRKRALRLRCGRAGDHGTGEEQRKQHHPQQGRTVLSEQSIGHHHVLVPHDLLEHS